MDKFEVLYRPEANGPIRRLRRARRKIIGAVVGYLVLMLVLGVAFVILVGQVASSLVWVLLVPALIMSVAFAFPLWLLSGRRTSAPPVALRLTRDGVAVWPMVGADFLLPWANVSALRTSQQGIAILPNPGTGPDTPGAMGLIDSAVRALLKKPERFHTEGFDWESLQPFDVNELDAATRGFSRGRTLVLTQ